MPILNRERLVAWPRIALAVTVLITGWWLATGPGAYDRGGKPLGGDFVTFHAAGRLVLEGRAADVFRLSALHAMEQTSLGGPVERLAWHYPPPALLAVTPLGALPLLPALLLATALSLLLYAGVLSRVDRGPVFTGLALAFPGLFQVLVQGQNGCVTLALLGGGAMLVDRRPLMGGALLALLVYKPHFLPVAALALLAGRRWRALAGLVLGSGAAVGASLALLGPAPWRAFVNNLPFAHRVLFEGGVPWGKMPTTAAMALGLGAPPAVAMATQGVVALAAAAAVARVWWIDAPLALRGASLALGALLVPHFAFDYDLVVLALPLAWLGVEAARGGWRRGEVAAVVLGWTLPVSGTVVGLVTGVNPAALGLAWLMALVVRRAGLSPR